MLKCHDTFPLIHHNLHHTGYKSELYAGTALKEGREYFFPFSKGPRDRLGAMSVCLHVNGLTNRFYFFSNKKTWGSMATPLYFPQGDERGRRGGETANVTQKRQAT